MNAKLVNTKIQVRVGIVCLLLQVVLVPFTAPRCLANEITSNYQATTKSEITRDVAKIIAESKALEEQDDAIKSKSIVDEMIANSKGLDNTTSDCEADVPNIINTSEKAIKTHGSSGMFKDLDTKIEKPKGVENKNGKKEQYLSDEYSRYIFIWKCNSLVTLCDFPLQQKNEYSYL